MKRFSFFLVFLAYATWISAQNLLPLSISDAVLKRNSMLAPERLSQLQWSADGSTLGWVANDKLVLMPAGKSKGDTVLTRQTLNGYLLQSKLDTLKKFPAITLLNANEFRLSVSDSWYVVNRKTGAIKMLIAPDKLGENPDYHQGSNQMAYTLDADLWVLNGQTGQKTCVGKSEKKGVVYGQSVHRNEFGITKGTFWSPEGTSLAFYRMDESMVTEYPIYQLSDKPATTKLVRYPFAGATSHQVTVGVFNTKTGKTTYLNTGLPAEQYLTNVSWSADEKTLFIAIVNREQNHMWLNAYLAATGEKIATLFEETDPKYTEPEKPFFAVPAHSEWYIWQSERDGFNHLYLYSKDGKLIRQLTQGNFVITDLLGVDPSGKRAYAMATVQSPTERHLLEIDLNSGIWHVVDARPGTHTVSFNASFTYFTDQLQNTSVPREINVFRANGKLAATLLKASNPLTTYAVGNVKLITLMAADGKTTLHGRLITPSKMSPDAKYPVLVYVYGGPHAQMVNNTWLGGADLWMLAMAEKGWVIFTVDNRGSLNRGRDFEQATFRQLGKVEMEDQMKGIEYLATLGYADTSRMAIFGWSFGGFMSTGMVLNHPGLFKAGVAGGPVLDWSMYEVMYTERYMDTPQENPEGYANNRWLSRTADLKDPFLMIHGTSDDVVLWQHSLLFVKGCVSSGRQMDYFVYPEHEHNVLGADRAHLMVKVTDYILSHVK